MGIRAYKQELEKIEAAREMKGLTLAKWAEIADVSEGTLNRFREGIIDISQSSFVKICKAFGIENWQDIVDNEPEQDDNLDNLTIDFIAYDQTWVGREDIINSLKKKINGSARITILNGLTGIGKTAIAEKLYTELTTEKQWHKLLRVNFDYQETSDFGNFLTVVDRWLKECGILVIPEDKQDISRLQKKIIEYTQKHNCLIIIDSLEWILQGNQEHGWSEFKDRQWATFFQLFLSQPQCHSRIIITTQHLPEDVSAGYDNFWFSEKIPGLEPKEQLELFKKIGVEINSETALDYLQRIGKVYEGHTFTLKVIAGSIKSAYQGNIIAYWQEEGKEEIEKVEKDLQSSQTNITTPWELHKANRDLHHKISYKFNKTFERLKKYNYYAYLLICVASTYLIPHSKEDLLEHLKYEQCSEKEKLIALQTLRDEQLLDSFIQENTRLFTLHNLVRSVAYEHFKNLD